jgi:hypothetical protein
VTSSRLVRTATGAGERLETIANVVVRALGSTWFFVLVVVGFATQAFAIALSAHRIIVDEGYHLGIIRLYAQQWSPFLANTEASQNFGDVERYGSYVYHYLMSFPMRVVLPLGLDEDTVMVLMRVVTVLLFLSSFPAFRALLRALGATPAVANVSLLLFAALPLSSFTAATVNYDNLIIPLFAVVALLGVRLVTTPRPTLAATLGFLTVGMVASLTKYTFLPVFAGAVIVLLVVLAVRRERTRSLLAGVGAEVRTVRFWLVAAAFVGLIALFVERYLRNLLDYGTPAPDCAKIESEAYCYHYGPWRRNSTLDEEFPDQPKTIGNGLFYYVQTWVPALLRTVTLSGTITDNGPRGSNGLPITASILMVAIAVTTFILLVTASKITRVRGAAMVAVPFVVTVLALFWLNYSDYRAFGQVLGVSSRYLLHFAPLVIGATVAGLALILRRIHARPAVWQVGFVLIGLALITQGGGALNFFVSADDSWFLSNSPLGDLPSLLNRIARRIMVLG